MAPRALVMAKKSSNSSSEIWRYCFKGVCLFENEENVLSALDGPVMLLFCLESTHEWDCVFYWLCPWLGLGASTR